MTRTVYHVECKPEHRRGKWAHYSLHLTLHDATMSAREAARQRYELMFRVLEVEQRFTVDASGKVANSGIHTDRVLKAIPV